MKRNDRSYQIRGGRRLGGNERGFTLIEVLIAMFILMVGLLAVAKMQIQAMQGNAAAMRASEKTAIAQNFIDELSALDYTDPDNDPPSADYELTEGTHTAPAGDVPDGIASVQWVVEEDPAGGETNTKRIRVTVTPERGEPVSLTTVKPQAQG